MTDRTDEFIAWLKELPRGAEVVWHDPGAYIEEQWAGGWVYVSVEAFKPGMESCGIVFIPPKHARNAPSDDHFVLERDLEVHAVTDPNTGHCWFSVEIPLPKGELPNQEQEALLAKALAAHSACKRGIRGGWSVERLTAGLQNWAEKHAHRPDLCWTWNPDWQMPAHIAALITATMSGTEPSYRIGNGLVVSEQAFGALLSMPGAFSPRRRRRRIVYTPPAVPDDPFDI